MSAVDRFRARFRELDEARRAAPRATPDERIREALALHGFNLLLAIDQVRNQLEAAGEEAVLAEVNRRRLASSPMPRSLRGRWSDVKARPH